MGMRKPQWRSTFGSMILWSWLFLVLQINDLYAFDNGDLPDDNVVIVNAEELILKAQQTKNLILIDSRNPADRRFGKIEGSVSLPDTQTNCISLSKVAADLSQPLVFYCNGTRCARSTIAVKIARQCGYVNVYWFKGGMEEWRQKRYPVLVNGE